MSDDSHLASPYRDVPHFLPTPQPLQGTVVHGQQLGRRLGYPTANLDVAHLDGQLPAPGVYAAWATLADGSRHRAMVNVGYRPTVDADRQRLTVEAHLDAFSADLYGQSLCLLLVARIRDEHRMYSLDQLRAQLAADLAATRRALS